MKSFAALLLILALQTSCTTLANRRDLYSPEPGPEYETSRATTTKTTTTREEIPPAPLPPPAR
ncbi:MAG: hypothetical protein M3R59_04155 [Verrucomicrobiota bacterium]|nr:hypothetical protein [Verrucomicrobiota bacterium]